MKKDKKVTIVTMSEMKVPKMKTNLKMVMILPKMKLREIMH